MSGDRPRQAAALTIDILVQSDLWRARSTARATVRRALAAAACAPATKHRAGEVSVLLTDDAAIRVLNRDWRGRDAATNVLSFPTPASAGNKSKSGGAAKHLGDIVIAYETVAREAEAERKPFGHHLAHLAVHGFLHLVGFDHASEREATAMEQRERDILATLGVPDPYAERRPARGINARA